ncbi:MAG: hypothetical protein H6828_03800 [Planctomycetes bacterium]|nr:hypothetical protein [Planctomycetota bacterium]
MNSILRSFATAAAVALVSTVAAAQVGASYCFGVGCPCGNDDPNAGCGSFGGDFNSNTGALLLHSGGNASALQDSLEFTVYGIGANQFGVLFMGGGQGQSTFGDGLRCVTSGGRGVHRFPVFQTDFFGDVTLQNIVSGSQGFPGAGAIQPGSSWNFQVWYRDPSGPCGNGFNLTNAIPVDFFSTGGGGNHTQLAGRPLAQYPHFEYTRTFNSGDDVYLAVDPGLQPSLMGVTADVYVVAAKGVHAWASDPSLVDVRGAATQVTFGGSNVQANTFLIDAGTLNGTVGTEVGIGYDMVVDANQNGVYDAGDLIDGLSDEAGFYVVRDVAAPGPYSVVETLYSGGTFLGQNTFYPANIASLGQVPLVVVSHGNGHNYQWYDHIGNHLASYGYVVMSHQNNTGPGIETASTTTLTNTDWFLGNLATIDGGILNGHIDSHRITWIGHSRGGEGVVRAWTRLSTGAFVPANFTAADIQLVSSIAPVTFLSPTQSNPAGVNYHLWVGSSDDDVNGLVPQTHFYALLERANQDRSSITIQGAGHGAFHNGTAGLVATGPCLLTRAEVHAIMRGQLLPLVKHYIDGDIPSKDFLWRQWESFKPIGAPPTTNPCVVVTFDYKDGPAAGNVVLDDFSTNSATNLSSSGQAVAFNVQNLSEENERDTDSSFAWTGVQGMNGMTHSLSTDQNLGTVFDWTTPSFWEVHVDPFEADFTDDAYLSFRAAQGTRHPNTIAALGDLDFTVTLRDVNGITSSIKISAYGGGIEEPYQRSGGGSGAGVGWHDEMETVRVRLSDFLANGSGINLFAIDAVRFDFGGTSGSAQGRLGLDDVEITKD